jgi:hypothetical protein
VFSPTDSVSIDLHQQRLNGFGRLLSFGRTCGRLQKPKNHKPPFKNPETLAAVGHEQTFNRRRR